MRRFLFGNNKIINNILCAACYLLVWATFTYGFENLIQEIMLLVFDYPQGLLFFYDLRVFLYAPTTSLFAFTLQSSYILSGFLAAFITFAIFVSHKQLTGDDESTLELISKSSHSGIDILIRDIEHRVQQLQRRSNLVLSIIVASLLIGVILIIFAGKLTTADAESASNMALIKQEIDNFDLKITSIDDRISNLIHPKKVSAFGSKTSASSSSETKETDVETAQPLTMDDPDIKALQENKKGLETRRENAVASLNKMWNNEATVTNKDKLKDTNYITATFLTRIGILAILIFLVQILISLYKYNTRIVAFYIARLDCLRFSGGDLAGFHRLIELMMPINVDFGRDPQHPIQTFFDAWRRRSDSSKVDGAATEPRQKRRPVKPASAIAVSKPS